MEVSVRKNVEIDFRRRRNAAEKLSLDRVDKGRNI